MKTFVAVVLLAVIVAACGGGGSTPTRAPATGAAPTAGPVATSAAGDPRSAEALCGLLAPEDWQQFGYVTGASPDIVDDQPGSAICQFASGLFLEVYTHDNDQEAEQTFETILENIPVDEEQQVPLPGADQAIIDPEIDDGQHALIVVRKGPLTYTVTTRSGDEAQAELLALAGLVMARSTDLQ